MMSILLFIYLKVPKPEEDYYLERLQEEDEKKRNEAKQILIERNLRLVAHIAKKYQGTEVEMEDLISIGTVGLIKAILSYNKDKKSKLGTYAARCIENAILSQMRLWWRTNLHRVEKNQKKAWLFNQQYQNYEDIPNVQDRLRWCRHHMGLMQKEVAELIGVFRGH